MHSMHRSAWNAFMHRMHFQMHFMHKCIKMHFHVSVTHSIITSPFERSTTTFFQRIYVDTSIYYRQFTHTGCEARIAAALLI